MFRIIAIAHAIFAVAHAYEDDHDDHWNEDHEEDFLELWTVLFEDNKVCCPLDKTN